MEIKPKLTPTPQWERASHYIASGRCPLNLQWILFNRKPDMLRHGCAIQVGRSVLVDHERLMRYLEALSRRNEGLVPQR
ncbi:MAG: hypothetical protein P8O70_20935 [SAR324 cluster bacterium]|nr:hypothetical protein [SAR324 cluster bacterium]